MHANLSQVQQIQSRSFMEAEECNNKLFMLSRSKGAAPDLSEKAAPKNIKLLEAMLKAWAV